MCVEGLCEDTGGDGHLRAERLRGPGPADTLFWTSQPPGLRENTSLLLKPRGVQDVLRQP